MTKAPSIDDVTVLVPAAGPVSEGIFSVGNVASPAMIPVGGRPVVYWTLNYLRSLGLRRFRFAVARKGMFIEEFVDCLAHGDLDIGFMVPSRDGGVGFTVAELMEDVATQAALVVLGDTYFRFDDVSVLDSSDPFVLVHPVDESYRWCVAEVGSDGDVTGLLDKVPGLPVPLQGLVGVYHFPDAELARRSCREAVAEGPHERVELVQILERVRSERSLLAYPAAEWLDVGNPDRQAVSHRALLQQRAFNRLEVDERTGTITKRSSRIPKFVDEINYLRLLPSELAIWFPRVVDSSVDWRDPWLKLEYYGYPTLSDAFVFENIDPATWERVFHHLAGIVEEFMSYEAPLDADAVRVMCLEKPRKRLEELTGPNELLELLHTSGPLVVNDREISNLPALWPRLEEEVDGLTRRGTGSVVHGDLCLSNVLYDFRSRVCRLIDPRGSFGRPGIYGDPRYDVAKLYHSVHGMYDLITNDLFRLDVQGRHVLLDVRMGAQHREIRERFDDVFFDHFERREILLITALILLSLPPLHYEAPSRQTAFYIRALELLGEYFSSE